MRISDWSSDVCSSDLFAINADGSSPFDNYVEHMQGKRAGYKREELDFFETTSAQARDGTLLQRLEAELVKRDIPLTEKSTEEILKAIEPVVITHYQKLIGVCIKHIRASQLTLEMLLERAKSLHDKPRAQDRSEEHTSELQSLMRISYAVFCLKKKLNKNITRATQQKMTQHLATR